MQAEPSAVERLADRHAIAGLLFEYCKSLDMNDPDGVVAVFSEDCVVELYDGPDGVTVGREVMRARLPDRYSRFAATSHHLSNLQIDFDGSDSARSISYLYAWHRFADLTEGEIWGQYHDVLKRTPEGWRIAYRRLCVAGQRNFARSWFGIGRRQA
jgi:3-phenylpropionate/cinnamic acid dioxygenase small subunit